MKTIDAVSAVEEAIGRSALYGLLARALAFPDDAQREAATELIAGLAPLSGHLAAGAIALVMEMPDADALGAAYARVFTHSSSRDCPPFETAYSAKEIFQQTQTMADIAGFYRAFGVEPVPGGERVDHICSELEFMQLLAAKEAYAYQHMGVARVRQCRRVERLFLRDHLACWGPSLGRRVALLDPDGWYGRVSELLAAWIEEECRALDVVPAQVVDGPVLPWPEPDEDGPAEDSAIFDGCDGCPAMAGAGSGTGAAPPGFIPLPLIQN